MIHNQNKNQSIETDPIMRKMMELADKDAKAVIINMLHMLEKCRGKYEHNEERKRR